MKIGILGSGLMGGRLGTIFARAGHEVIFTSRKVERSMGKESPEEVAARDENPTLSIANDVRLGWAPPS